MKASDLAGTVVSAFVVIGFFAVMVLWFIGLSPKGSQEFTMLIGALIAAFTTVVLAANNSGRLTRESRPGAITHSAEAAKRGAAGAARASATMSRFLASTGAPG